jgi:hypothetical protein
MWRFCRRERVRIPSVLLDFEIGAQEDAGWSFYIILFHITPSHIIEFQGEDPHLPDVKYRMGVVCRDKEIRGDRL